MDAKGALAAAFDVADLYAYDVLIAGNVALDPIVKLIL